MKKPEDYLRNGEIYVWKEVFAVAKVTQPLKDAFATVHDKQGMTCIIEQSKVEQAAHNVLEIDKDWKIITFDMLLPMDLVGFIASITSKLAEEGISVLYVSAYSTDHVLVQAYDLEKTIQKLQSMGCRVSEK